MKVGGLLLLLIALLAAAVPAAAQDEVLLSFTGYDYQTDGSPNTTYLALGDSYYAVGFVTSFHPTWLDPYTDPGTHEYTLYQHGLVVDSYLFSGNVLQVTFAPGGVVEYFEDASKDAQNPPNPPNCPRYGSNPPNADAPSKFINGTLAISGSLDNASLYYDYNGTGQGGFQSEMNITGGADAIYVPAPSWNGWFMSGLVIPPAGGNPCVAPAGYDHQISGECRHPVVATSRGTWGQLKKLYR
jgi:hypothetical protein